MKIEHKQIGEIGNYYGGLHITEHEGRYYWMIHDVSSDMNNIADWDEIDKELYDSLIAYEGRITLNLG